MQHDGATGGSESGRGQPRGFEDAACRPFPTSWWFTDGPEDVEATLICMGCRVRRSCLDYALEHAELLGIWAATTPEDRAEIRSARHPSLGGPSEHEADPGA